MIPITNTAYLPQTFTWKQNISKLFSPITKACSKVAACCFKTLNHLFFRKQSSPFISEYEAAIVDDLGKLMQGISPCSMEKINQFFNELIMHPSKIKNQTINSLRSFEKKGDAFKVNNQIYIENLRLIRDTSHLFSCLNTAYVKESIDNKLTKILDNLTDPSKLSNLEKISIEEIYLIYCANKIHKKLANHSIQPLDNEFRTNIEFYQKCDKVMQNCWKNISNNNRTILFFSEKKYQNAHKKKPTLISSFMKFARRGDPNHTALLIKGTEPDDHIQAHITKSHYEETPLKFIELLASDAIVFDITKLLTPEAKHRLEVVLSTQDKYPKTLENTLNLLWEKELHYLLAQQKCMGVKNSKGRQFLCGAKWFGFPPKRTAIGSHQASTNMICSEFIITLISQILNNIDQELKTLDKLQSDNRSFLNNPFQTIPAASMTPGDLFRALKLYGSKEQPLSPFLNAILNC